MNMPLILTVFTLFLSGSPPPAAAVEDFSTCQFIEQPAGTTYQHDLPAGMTTWAAATGYHRVALTDIYTIEQDQHEPTYQIMPGMRAQPFAPIVNDSPYTWRMTFTFAEGSTLALCAADPCAGMP
jgi:hypothetical protein